MERRGPVSKSRLLEVYLNVIEWGPGIFGVTEASRFYFHKNPIDLNLGECTFLASIIPMPKKVRWFLDSNGCVRGNNGHFSALRRRLLAKDSGSIDTSIFQVCIHPDVPGIAGDRRFDGFRRNWLNIFQINPKLRVLANHAASDNCTHPFYKYTDIARYTPPLADGLTALDLIRESANASQLGRNFTDSPLLQVPAVYWDFCTTEVMVMQRMHGTPVSQIDVLREQGVDIHRLARDGVEIFFAQVFRDGYFHADMHPGNIFVDVTTPAFPKYVAVDFGIVGTLDARDQHYLAENFLAFFRRDYNHRVVTPLVILSIPAAVSIHTVTAFLLATNPSRPMWFHSMMPIRFIATAFAAGVRKQGHTVVTNEFFDTVHVKLGAGRTAADVKTRSTIILHKFYSDRRYIPE